MLQILNWKIGKLRKYIRVWPFYFVAISCSKTRITSLQGQVATFIKQHKALSLVACFSIVVLLVNFFLVLAQRSLVIAEKSQFVSQPACLSCSSTKSRDKYQEPFVFPPRNAAATQTPPSSTPVGFPTTNTQTVSPIQGSMNLFPNGSCTWWANQRYFQLHGFYVPWRTQSDAWQWTARAYQFGWHVSGSPVVGAIIDLQPGVQGASWAGHVAVVERILSNGDVIASNMNWGAYPWQVTYIEFAPGPGVTFLYL